MIGSSLTRTFRAAATFVVVANAHFLIVDSSWSALQQLDSTCSRLAYLLFLLWDLFSFWVITLFAILHALFSQVVPPNNGVFLADNSVVTHYLYPIFKLVIDVDIPDGTLCRILLISHRNWNQSLQIVVHILFLVIEEWHKVSIKFIALLFVKSEPIHDVSKGQFWLLGSDHEIQKFFWVGILHLHIEARQFLWNLEAGFRMLASAAAPATSTSFGGCKRQRILTIDLGAFGVGNSGRLVLQLKTYKVGLPFLEGWRRNKDVAPLFWASES